MGPFHRGRPFAPPRRRRWWWILILFPAVLAAFSEPLRPAPEPSPPEWLPPGYVAHRGPDGRVSYRMRRPKLRRLLNRLHLRVRWPKRTHESVSSEEREPVGTTRHGVPIFVEAREPGYVAGWRPVWQRKHSPKGWPVAWKPLYAVFGAAAIVGSAAGGNWNANGAWVGGVQPTAADDVTFTAATGNITIPAGVTAVCRSLDCTGYVGTLTFAATTSELDVGDASGGALKFVSTMTLTLTGVGLIKFVSTTAATTYSLTTGGKTMPGVTVATGSTTTIQAADSWTCGAGTFVILTSGKLDTNGQTCSWGLFNSSNVNTRSLTLGASAITITGSSATVWNIATVTGLTFSGASASVTTNGTTGSFNHGGSPTYGNITLSGSGTPAFQSGTGGTITCTNFTRTGSAAKTDTLSMAGGGLTVTGVFLVTGNSLTNRVIVQSNAVGTTRTITVNGSHGAHANVDFADITIAGTAGNLTGTSVGDALGNSGITFTAAVTRYAVVAGNWSSTTTWATTDGGGGGASVPLCHDTVILNGNSAAGTYAADMPRMGKDITCTGFTRTLSRGISGQAFFGSLTLAAGMTMGSNTNIWIASGRSSHSITSAGITNRLTITAPGGTYTLADATSSLNGFIVTGGTFDAAGFSVTQANVTVSGGTVNMGSGTWTLTGTGTVWSVTAGTVNASTSIIDLTNNTATARTFAGGGKTYATVRSITNTAGATLAITGANTFDTLTVTIPVGGSARTLTLPAGVTTTVTNLTLAGIAGALLTVNSSTGGTQATLSVATGTVIADYVALSDSAATGGANFYATHSTKGSNVTGWYVGQVVTLGQAVAANTGQPLRAQHAVELGEAVVTNAGLPAAARKQVNLGEAVAANAGLPVVPAQRRTVGEAQEADTGVKLARAIRLGMAQEADSGRLLVAVQRALLGLSAEVDAALAPRALHRRGLGLAVEVDRAVGLVKVVVVGPAIEHDEALSAAFPPVIIRLNASNGHVLPLLASWARTLSFPRPAHV